MPRSRRLRGGRSKGLRAASWSGCPRDTQPCRTGCWWGGSAALGGWVGVVTGENSAVCPARAAPGEDSGDGTVPSPSSTHHVSLPDMPPRVGNSPPSHLDTSGDVPPAPTSHLHLGPDPLLFTSPSLLCSPAHVHQKAIVRACLHPTTIPRSGGQLVLPLSCIFPEGSAPVGASFPIRPGIGGRRRSGGRDPEGDTTSRDLGKPIPFSTPAALPPSPGNGWQLL